MLALIALTCCREKNIEPMYSRIFHIAGAALQQPVEDSVKMHHQQAHEKYLQRRIHPGVRRL